MGANMPDQFSLFAADSPASLTPLPGSKEAQMITAHYGQKCSESYAKYSPLGSFVKTLLGSSVWNSTKCYLIWKVRATPGNRLIFQLAESMPTTYAIESGLLPTPAAKDYGSNQGGGSGNGTGPKRYGLSTLARLWATPSARDWKDTPGMSSTGVNPDGSERQRLDQLARQVYATPDVGAAKGRGQASADARGRLGGSLNPAWVEWLQGYPIGWTDCED
jgi:hypothetical protein